MRALNPALGEFFSSCTQANELHSDSEEPGRERKEGKEKKTEGERGKRGKRRRQREREERGEREKTEGVSDEEAE